MLNKLNDQYLINQYQTHVKRSMKYTTTFYDFKKNLDQSFSLSHEIDSYNDLRHVFVTCVLQVHVKHWI